jgi:ribosomal protein L1
MTASSRIDRCEDAARVLSEFGQRTATTTRQDEVMSLFTKQKEASRAIQVELSFIRAPVPNRVPLYLRLPHDTIDTQNVCLVTPVPQRDYKEQLQGSQSVAKVVDIAKLTAKYSNPVARRALAKAFDAFFVHCDLEKFPELLTGEFLSRQTPVWLDSAPGTLEEKIAATRKLAVCPRRGFDNVAISVAHCGMGPDAIADNVFAALDNLVSHLEGGWKDILSARLSTSNADGQRVALPIYAHDFAEHAELPVSRGKRSRQ